MPASNLQPRLAILHATGIIRERRHPTTEKQLYQDDAAGQSGDENGIWGFLFPGAQQLTFTALALGQAWCSGIACVVLLKGQHNARS